MAQGATHCEVQPKQPSEVSENLGWLCGRLMRGNGRLAMDYSEQGLLTLEDTDGSGTVACSIRSSATPQTYTLTGSKRYSTGARCYLHQIRYCTQAQLEYMHHRLGAVAEGQLGHDDPDRGTLGMTMNVPVA
jgi:hypothetical protein